MNRAACIVTLVSLLVLPLTAAEQPQILKVPAGSAVLPDGRMESAEWKDAALISFGDHGLARVKRDDDYLYVGVQPATTQMFGIDLYFDDGRPTVLNLHASASLGERDGSGDTWPEWSWWNNRDWIANVTRVESWEPRKFLRDDAKEFQIRLNRFGRSAIGFGLDVATRDGALMLPAGEPGSHGRTWIRLDLGF